MQYDIGWLLSGTFFILITMHFSIRYAFCSSSKLFSIKSNARHDNCMSKQFVNDDRAAHMNRCGEAALAPLKGELSARTGWLRGLLCAFSGRETPPVSLSLNRLLTVVWLPPAIIILKNSLRSATPFQGRRGHFVPAGRQIGDPYVAHSIDNVFIYI